MEIEEAWAHELEGQIIIIETVSDKEGKRRPAGYCMRVRLEKSGLIVSNVVSIALSPMPLLPNSLISAEITLCHIGNGIDAATYETVTVQNPKLSFAAFVKEEHHEMKEQGE